jgi:hypothetical protein
MLKNITFIGDKERSEAINGIAAYWKSYLRENPNREICALAEISDANKIKSDKFLLDGILSQFSEDEMKELGDRIVLDFDKISSEPEDVKVVLLDDWIISGNQMTSAYRRTKRSSEFKKFADSIEVQLITSTKHRIQEGLIINGYGAIPDDVVPIRSYFMSHDAEKSTAYDSHRAYETGSHSSVDYDFEVSFIDPMLEELRKISSETGDTSLPKFMPSLTAIIRPYRGRVLPELKGLDSLHQIHSRQKVSSVSSGSEKIKSDIL